MQESLRESELAFLAHYHLSTDDVFDGRRYSQDACKYLAKEQGKEIVLGGACRKAGHRLRTRYGHCVQCDPKKLAFVKRHSAQAYVYIAGSRSGGLIKIGTCRDYDQRLRQLCAERYGDCGDWKLLSFVMVDKAGDLEISASKKLWRYAVTRGYWKDGNRQAGIELFTCSYSLASEALTAAAQSYTIHHSWTSRYTSQYEFAPVDQRELST